MAIGALVFDAYGTLYDVRSVRTLADRLCGENGALVTEIWRLKQLEYTWLCGLMRQYRDFRELTRASLEFALEAAGLAPSDRLCDPLMDTYLALALYPEAREALQALRDRTLSILSNGTPAMLGALVAASGLEGTFATVMSVDAVRSFKPDPACYRLVIDALKRPADEILFVSSNGFDVAGAKAFGFKVAWVDRSVDRSGVPAAGSSAGPSDFFRLLRGRVERHAPGADIRVARLTDIPDVLRSHWA